ncbi:plant U-box 24 [Abeliophyllum distichum]|uniref:U-box domain-containing protein n=1 Tax=Abeliophyllum distichum TaxID=126358 RepID=A0ABD1VUK9_9LAMI
MDGIEIPQYFLCPISLQIMKDPVTTVTGITYDRESIEQWLLAAAAQPSTTCPVTKQPLHKNSDLTPNHMLRRLIQAWCIANGNRGIDRIPSPKSPISKSNVVKLIRDLENPVLFINSLKKMDELASENENNRKCMAEIGAAKAMVTFILRCFREGNTTGLAEALRILRLTWNPTPENKQLLKDSFDFFQSITWILKTENDQNDQTLKTQAVLVLKMITEIASSSVLERLKPDFFKELINILRKTSSQQAIKSVLQTLVEICPLGRNRMKIVEAGAVFHLIEMELSGHLQEKKSTTELIFCLLAQLCSCADGRAQLLKHAGGIGMVSKRLLRVSAATDDKSLNILALISRFSATREVLMEMLSVGAVSKICMVIQADCADYLQKKAREILRLHSNVWSNSPCIQVYLMTRYPR